MSSESPANDSEGVVYALMTLPSLNKNLTKSKLKKIRATIPDAEIRDIIKETLIYRLEVRCFADRQSAKKLQANLFNICKSPFIVPTEDSYCVIAGSQMDYNAAVEDQKYFAKKHLNTSIVKTRVPLQQWQIVIGNYNDIKNSVYMANKMTIKGLTTTIQPVEKKQINKSKTPLEILISKK